MMPLASQVMRNKSGSYGLERCTRVTQLRLVFSFCLHPSAQKALITRICCLVGLVLVPIKSIGLFDGNYHYQVKKIKFCTLNSEP